MHVKRITVQLRTYTSSLLSEEIRTLKRTRVPKFSTLLVIHELIHRGKICSITETSFGERTRTQKKNQRFGISSLTVS